MHFSQLHPQEVCSLKSEPKSARFFVQVQRLLGNNQSFVLKQALLNRKCNSNNNNADCHEVKLSQINKTVPPSPPSRELLQGLYKTFKESPQKGFQSRAPIELPRQTRARSVLKYPQIAPMRHRPQTSWLTSLEAWLRQTRLP